MKGFSPFGLGAECDAGFTQEIGLFLNPPESVKIFIRTHDKPYHFKVTHRLDDTDIAGRE